MDSVNHQLLTNKDGTFSSSFRSGGGRNSELGSIWLTGNRKHDYETVSYWVFKNSIQLAVIAIFFLLWPFANSFFAVLGGIISIVLVAVMAFGQTEIFGLFEELVSTRLTQVSEKAKKLTKRLPWR